MDSSSARLRQERLRKEELEQQIARLQAQLAEIPRTKASAVERAASPKQKKPEPTLLAPATPSPRKKRKLDHKPHHPPMSRTLFQRNSASSKLPTKQQITTSIPGPSNLLRNLANVKCESQPARISDVVSRSGAFNEKPCSLPLIPIRDESLTIIEDLQPGPYDHNPPSDDPTFEKLEPHSGIVLTSRHIPHEDFKDHLRGRYYLSPSQLYSTIRLEPDKQCYDIPIPGDWITIAVVAERGPLKYSRAPVTLGPNEDVSKRKNDDSERKPTGKKYVNMKLIDFGARTRSSASGGKAVVRGDSFLSLLLFEADSFDLVTNDNGKKPQKVYKGGSRGAFESLAKLKEGDVVALLNPRILKPFQRSNDKPHPVDNILALTPESASSIAVIGRSRDLGMCTVLKRDGKPCGSWCDKRVSDVCDYHVQNAVQHRRAARPEFSAGTSGMTTSATVKRKTDYDPARQWGLKPERGLSEGGSTTYVVSGHIVGGGSSDSRSVYATENMGREGQAKAKRKLDQLETDRALKKLLERDREGVEAVLKAREVRKEMLEKEEEKDAGKATGKGKGKDKQKEKRTKDTDPPANPTKAYSSSVIRSLGFDPSVKPGHRKTEHIPGAAKFEALETVRAARKTFQLGRRPGPRIRSGVVAPVQDEGVMDSTAKTDTLHNFQHSDEDLPDHIFSEQLKDESIIDLDDI